MSTRQNPSGSYRRLDYSTYYSEVQNQETGRYQLDIKQDQNQQNDNKLNEFFQQINQNDNPETIEIDYKTKKDLFFQMNEEETVLYDFEKKTLLNINTVHKNKEKKKFEVIIKQISYEQIFQKAFENDRNEEQIEQELFTNNLNNQINHAINEGGEDEGEEEQESSSESLKTVEDVKPEEKLGDIQIVVSSSDKKKILLGNSEGRTFILDAQTFEYKQSFINENGESIQFLSGNEEILVSASDKTLMLYDQLLPLGARLTSKIFDKIERVIVSPYSNHIVIQDQETISVYEYSKINQQQEGKLEKLQELNRNYQEGQILKFTQQCFFFWDIEKLQVFQILHKKWKTVQNLFAKQDKNKTKIQFIEPMPDKKNLFVLAQYEQEIKTYQVDSQTLETLIIEKEQNFFVMFENSSQKYQIFVNQSGLILFKTAIQENIEISQLIQEDQELICFISNDDQKIKFIQICDRSLKTPASRYPLIWNEKKFQIVINGQVVENLSEFKNTKTKILYSLDYSTQNQIDDGLQNLFNEIQFEKEQDIAIYAISEDSNYYYGQNKDNEIIKIDSENFNIQPIIRDGTRHHALAIDNNKFLYYKQGKSIYQINLESKDKIEVLQVYDQHIKDWKLTFNGQFLLAISESHLYKYDIAKKQQSQYSFIYNLTQQKYNFERQNLSQNSVKLQKDQKNQNKNEQKDGEKVLDNFKKIDISPDDEYLTLTSSKSNEVWIIKLQDLTIKHKIEVGYKKNKQTERTISCYFKQNRTEKGLQITQALTIFTIDNNQNQDKPKIEGWDVTNMVDWQRLFILKDQLIEPIVGYNQKLKGLLIDKKIRIWPQIFDEYTSIIPNKLPNHDKSDQNYISGPRNLIFPLIFKQFLEQDDNDVTQLQLMPYMIKNLVVPFRFSFFSYLAFRSKGKLIKDALKLNSLRLVRDYFGFHPLHYLIIKSNFEQTSDLIKYIGKKPSLIKQLRQKEIADLLRFGPLFLDEFLQTCVKTINSKECQKVNENKQTYLLKNGIQVKNFDHFQKQLTLKDSDDQDKMPAQFKMSLIPLNLKFASQQSLDLMKAIDENEVLEIYRTDFLKNIIEEKWQGISSLSGFFLFFQFLQLGLVFYHSYHPGWFSLYIALIISGLKYLLVEWLVFISLGLTQKINKNDSYYDKFKQKIRFNSYISIILGILLLLYSFFNLYAFNQWYSARGLPVITMLSWLCLIRDLEIFQIVRDFNLKFIYSLIQSFGFITFLGLMLGTLTMTRTILQKVIDKEEAVAKLNLGYNPSVEILGHDQVYTSRSIDIDQGVNMTFDVVWAMVRGDFESENFDFYGKIVGTTIVFITNVFLLNLLVAIMSDAYNEITTYSNEHLLKRENFITLRLEAIISVVRSIKNSSVDRNLFWIEYDSQDSEEWKSQAFAITERISKVFHKIFDEKLQLFQQDLEKLATNKIMALTKSKKVTDAREEIPASQANQDEIHQNQQVFRIEVDKIINSQKEIEGKVVESQQSIQKVVDSQILIKIETDKLNDFQVNVNNSLIKIQDKANLFQSDTTQKIDTLYGNQCEILEKVDSSQKSIQELQNEMKTEIIYSKNQIVDLQNNQKQIKQKVEESQKQIQQKVANLESQVTNLKTQVTSLQNQAVGFQAEVKKEISEMKNEITGTLAQILQKLQEKE